MPVAHSEGKAGSCLRKAAKCCTANRYLIQAAFKVTCSSPRVHGYRGAGLVSATRMKTVLYQQFDKGKL